jgi:hypothetical protein
MRRSRHFLGLSFAQRRVIATVTGVPFLVCCLDYFRDWHWLGPSGKPALIGCSAIALAVLAFIAPTISEMKAYNRKKATEEMARLTRKLSE